MVCKYVQHSVIPIIISTIFFDWGVTTQIMQPLTPSVVENDIVSRKIWPCLFKFVVALLGSSYPSFVGGYY